MRPYISLLIVVCFLLGVQSLHAKDDREVINIITPAWKGWTNADGSGFYFDIMREVFQEEHFEIKYQIAPFKRSKHMVQSGSADAMFGVFSEALRRDDIATPFYHIDEAYYSVVFKRTLVWDGIQSLVGKRIMIPRSYNIKFQLGIDFEVIDVSDSQQGLKMLSADREAYFVSDHDEIFAASQSINIPLERYRVEKINKHKLYVGFAGNAKGRKLARVFDRRFAELLHNKTVQGLQRKWGLEVDTWE